MTSLYALRTHLDAHLRMQLDFFIKVKFDMEVFLPGWGAIEPGVGAERIEDHYLLQPSPWLATPNGDADRRMRDIVETARLKLRSIWNLRGCVAPESKSVASSTSTCW